MRERGTERGREGERGKEGGRERERGRERGKEKDGGKLLLSGSVLSLLILFVFGVIANRLCYSSYSFSI